MPPDICPLLRPKHRPTLSMGTRCLKVKTFTPCRGAEKVTDTNSLPALTNSKSNCRRFVRSARTILRFVSQIQLKSLEARLSESHRVSSTGRLPLDNSHSQRRLSMSPARADSGRRGISFEPQFPSIPSAL